MQRQVFVRYDKEEPGDVEISLESDLDDSVVIMPQSMMLEMQNGAANMQSLPPPPGTAMPAMLGIFFSVHSAGLIEDVPFKEEDYHQIQDVYAVYNNVGYNCFIAAGIYVVIGLVS
ncbi:proline-, glutamic acid- and leucine-rich protein 1 [Silurus meridionalis]|nr:proline-, glutamic acid- and leucine-rich protein 1 [Silurus meridionalis]